MGLAVGHSELVYICVQFLRTICFFPFLFFFWPCSLLVIPQPGIKPVSSAVQSWSPNHWTSREFPIYLLSLKHDFWVCLCKGSRMRQSFELIGFLKQMALSGHQPTCC